MGLSEQFPNGVRFREDMAFYFPTKTRVSFLGKTRFSIEKIGNEEKELFNRLKQGIGRVEIEKWAEGGRQSKIIRVLDRVGYLRNNARSKGEKRWERQSHWLSHYTSAPDEAMEQISKKSVLVLGCGGTGAVMAEQLARAGVTQFGLIDGAVVDEPDLNRQLPYFPSDVGIAKVSALESYLKRINPQVRCWTKSEKVLSRDQLDKLVHLGPVDLILQCADQPIHRIHQWVAEVAASRNVAVLFGAVGLNDAHLGPLLDGEPELSEFAQQLAKEAQLFGDEGAPLRSSLTFTNSLSATYLAFDAFRFLSGIETAHTLNKTIEWNFSTNTFKTLKTWVSKR